MDPSSRAPESLPQNCYVKRPSLIDYGDTTASFELSALMLDEAAMCETLRTHAHPNIAQYYVEDGRIQGLCFDRYAATLRQRVGDPRPLDVGKCLRGIEDGVNHLHTLGLVHNDLNSSNIMMDGDDNPVVIDFDSCKSEGSRLGTKAGTWGWEKCDSVYAKRENDLYAVSKIREFCDTQAATNK